MSPTERPPRRSLRTLLGGRSPRPAPAVLEDDPLAEAFPMRRGLPALLFSAIFHGAVLVLLATISFAVVRRDERINVKVLDPGAELNEPEGAPSLHDLAGSLHPVTTAPRAAGSVAGPSATSAVASVRAPEMPRIAGIGPSIGQSPGTLDVPLSIGGGGLAGGGLGGGGFGDMLGGLRKVGIDLVLVIDTTDSMQSVLEDVKREVRAFIGDLQQMVPASRVAVVAYRDKGDEYVTKWVDFSFHTDKVQNFVGALRADGGGDYPEAVKAGVQAAVRELSWRKTARRILVIIGGSPPHKEDVPELLQVVRTFRDNNGAVGAIDVTDRLHVEYERADWAAHGAKGEFKATATPDFYREVTDSYADIARQGGGELSRLGEKKALLREVIALTFGTRWRVEMARYMDRLQ
ncbi:MAG: VWA domain-containing protein [Deltaproteobacteria bacterium]|nr:VWA domain-containing protein [Deltaproteobacteria bacterium]